MQLRKKPIDSDESAGAPEWMVTFSDCMTLLLTFFVLLLSFSSFDEHVYEKLKVIFRSMPAVSRLTEEAKDALLESPKQVIPTEDIDDGSEKPTLAKGWQDNLKQETKPEDFRWRKVFLIPSKRIFWARGTVISPQGRKILSNLALFLKEMPNQAVISEDGPAVDEDRKHFGLPRAWAVMEHLTTTKGLDKNRFSLSATNTLSLSEPDQPELKTERTLEILLLERSICN
jgi:chemotaxis protein MotB